DSSVGGKTAIDTPQGKNLIGAFWQPSAVIADTDCLRTLPKKQIVNGLIEAVKMFLTNDKESFYYLMQLVLNQSLLETSVSAELIKRAVTIKMNIVSQDERETGQRKILNFGHTIGHALEKVSKYQLLHGYAVALGILVEARISVLLGCLNQADYQIIQDLFFQLGISGEALKAFSVESIIQATKSDKKVKVGEVQYVLLEKIGRVYQVAGDVVHTVDDDVVGEALRRNKI
ncbi:MAG TPA: 3-dehydroquinate synthase family protein, partial [Gammaproteobacteria bacterium]|nr:3-dehydroquinate synthase family protein [Gammaproteobacteria bacterium]